MTTNLRDKSIACTIGILLAILPASPVYAKESKTAPSASRSKADSSAKRKVDYEAARKERTADAYEAFLKKYPKGADSDDLRSDLPPLIKLRTAIGLGKLALEMASSASVAYVGSPSVGGSNPGKLESQGAKIQSPPRLPTLLLKFREMLEKDADPSLIRISGYRPASKDNVGTSTKGNAMMFIDFGSPGRVVPAEQGGMTLLEYCKAIGQKEACDMLDAHSQEEQPQKVIMTSEPTGEKIIVTSEPAGADVWKEGTLVGTTTYVWPRGIPGTNVSYVLKLPNYEDAKVSGTVEIGKTLELKASLKPTEKQDSGVHISL